MRGIYLTLIFGALASVALSGTILMLTNPASHTTATHNVPRHVTSSAPAHTTKAPPAIAPATPATAAQDDQSGSTTLRDVSADLTGSLAVTHATKRQASARSSAEQAPQEAPKQAAPPAPAPTPAPQPTTRQPQPVQPPAPTYTWSDSHDWIYRHHRTYDSRRDTWPHR